MRFDGKLSSWNDARGFGFIEPSQGGQEIFIHIKSFPAGTGRPVVGLRLSFEVELGPQGKKRAKSVEFLRASRPARSSRARGAATWSVPRLLAIPGFVAVYLLVASRWPVSRWVAAAYLVASFAAFVAYAIDKSAARAGRWRTPESTLHAFGMACGWPGALLAQQFLRHKSSKPSFVAAFWVTVAINIGAFVFLHSPTARGLFA